MGKYERALQKGLEQLEMTLQEDPSSQARAEEVTHYVENLDFPALLAFLAHRNQTPKNQKMGTDLAREVAPKVASPGTDAGSIERFLTALLVDREVLKEPGLNLLQGAASDQILERAVSELAKETGVTITPDEARQILKLLVSGEFFQDISHSTAAIFYAVPGLPILLVNDVARIPIVAIRLPVAIAEDLRGLVAPPVLARIFRDILENGKLDNPPERVLTNTFRTLYGIGSLRSIAQLIGMLIAPENRTVRLALVIYARMNGIPLEEADLDHLRTSVLNTNQPDLGPVLVAAYRRLVERYGPDKAVSILRELALRQPL